MKYRLFFLCLALALLLSGCRLIVNDYSSTEPHTDSYNQSSENEELTVNDYDQLESTIRALIYDGTEETTLTTDVYSGDIEKDLYRAETFFTEVDPDAAYLVKSIDWAISGVGSYYKINMELQFQHQYDELQKKQTATNLSQVKEDVYEALSECREQLLLDEINYERLDFNQLVKEYCENHLTEVMAVPDVRVRIYPNNEAISRRIVELSFVYPLDSSSLRPQKQFVEYMIKYAKDGVSGLPSDLDRALQIYVRQFSGHRYTEEKDETPAFSLFINRKGDSRIFSAIYEAMCREADVNCVTVHGRKNGKSYDWNILDLESGVWHVDVNADAQSGAQELRLRTDADMAGYEWDAEAYPACVGLYRPVEPLNEENPVQEGEQSPEAHEGEQPTEPEDTPVPPEDGESGEPENNP